MKLNSFFLFLLFLSFKGFSQNKKTELSSESILKETTENCCKCIDSIPTGNRTKPEIESDIGNCIQKHSKVFSILSTLFEVVNKSKDLKDNDTIRNISVNIDTTSDAYYFELERSLMENCQAIKNKAAANDLETNKSFSKNPKALKLYDKGLELYKKEEFGKAKKYFIEALEIDKEFAFAWDNLGICYRKLGDYDKALEAYLKSLEIDPMGTLPLQNIAIVYEFKKEYKKAIEAYKKLTYLDENNPEIYYGIGQIQAVHLEEYESGLINMCKAYNLYIAQKSPYRSDAEKIIQYIYDEMSKQGKTDKFKEILDANNIKY